jgi:hypothetical protein
MHDRQKTTLAKGSLTIEAADVHSAAAVTRSQGAPLV